MTLGQLVKASGLARASLLHYERLGLLVPAGRSTAGYRLYSEPELDRLRTIRRFREAGLSLATIRELLVAASPVQDGQHRPAELLETRLLDLCTEVERLRVQQHFLARLLASPEFRASQPGQGKEAWVALLQHAGFDEADMRQWHCGFEADDPTGHATFLHSLGLAPAEIAKIRRWSKARRQ
jgi:DNA-binding transcriptional MerR regulator